ncbi:hypothetical protein EV702DRAFT_1043349 [Suillus placidus]|uniref:Uncharacterized protein n=1 Tax=Suillus placidus TaxID=48579 RepID=A0A9P7D4I1_9AGAM|nr:hypothetical protein EV702DRAFT_1043349 [Suillus placidus]
MQLQLKQRVSTPSIFLAMGDHLMKKAGTKMPVVELIATDTGHHSETLWVDDGEGGYCWGRLWMRVVGLFVRGDGLCIKRELGMSHRCSPSPRHQEGRDHTQTADKVTGNRVTKRCATWLSATAGDQTRSCSKGYIPHYMNPLLDPPSYPPNAIVRRMAGCTQAASKLGTCAQPGEPAPTDLHSTGKSLPISHQSDLAPIDLESQATLAKQASRETSRIRVILTAWEIEEAELHVELLQRTNIIEIYKEANDDPDLSLIISQDARNLKALMVDQDGGDGDSEESETDESAYNSNASDCC